MKSHILAVSVVMTDFLAFSVVHGKESAAQKSRRAMPRLFQLLSMFLVLVAVGSPARCEVAVVDGTGQIAALTVEGETLDVQVGYRIPLKGWGKSLGPWDARGVKVTRDGKRMLLTGRVEVEPDKRYAVEQTIDDRNDAVTVKLTFTAEAAVETEGVFLWIDVPIDRFAGGACKLQRGDRIVDTSDFPREEPAQRHFLRGHADSIMMSSPKQDAELDITFDRAILATVQDTREWNGTKFSAFCLLAPSLKKGESTSLTVTIKPSVRADTSPANLTLDVTRARYRLDGFGGNYCFGIESPITQYTLKNLDIAWARTEMTPYEWEPENDNDSPRDTDWEYLEKHDRPGSNLQREFQVAKQIQDMGVPYVISVWSLPRWLYENPSDRVRQSKRRIHPDKWDELLECLGSYLVYAKRAHGVEPDLFSFNEANIGVDVLLTAEEHREAIKRIGAHFATLGLKTRMLLADATGARGTHTYALPAANDSEALRYCGAIGFHSWGGAAPDEYAAWGDLAEKLKLPLLVTELGVDAGAWRTKAFDSYHYAMREVRMYQELLLHARPQGTMQWEFTSDYGIAKVTGAGDGETEVVPTARFHFVKHFCNLTPKGADALTTASDNGSVLFTAFRAGTDRDPACTLHIANLGPARSATITGIPASVKQLRAVQTTEAEHFHELAKVQPDGGTITLKLAAQSLLTLTTLD